MDAIKMISKSQELRKKQIELFNLEDEHQLLVNELCTHDIVVLTQRDDQFYSTCLFCEMQPLTTDYFYFDRLQKGIGAGDDNRASIPIYIFDYFHDEDRMVMEAQEIFCDLAKREGDLTMEEMARKIEVTIQKKHLDKDKYSDEVYA